MPAQRKLTEDEIDEQTRIAVKEELRAYFQGGQARTIKITDAHEYMKSITAQQNLKQAKINAAIKIMSMMSPKEKSNAVKKIKQKLLP